MKYPTVNHRQTSDFGYRKLNGKQDFHSGCDYGCLDPNLPTNDIIMSIARGIVKVAKADPDGYGNYVVIEHNGYCTLYAHLKEYNVVVGQKVEEGQKIGLMGMTGNTSAIHLHLEVRLCDYEEFWTRWSHVTNGGNREPYNAVDPEKFFMKRMECNKEDSLVTEVKKLTEKLNTIYK